MNHTVSVLMGSDSDWPIVRGAAETLERFGITVDVQVLSAHRTPQDVHDYVTRKTADGTSVFIAAAGMSAALAGTVAALTTRPVIGIPIDAGGLGGIDALLSTAQMPPGVPVAAMAIGAAGAQNAALLAVQIMAVADDTLHERLVAFKAEQRAKVLAKNETLRERRVEK